MLDSHESHATIFRDNMGTPFQRVIAIVIASLI